jgi:hypothetical protein
MEVLMGKSSINGQFSMAMLNNQRVCFPNISNKTICLYENPPQDLPFYIKLIMDLYIYSHPGVDREMSTNPH